MSKKKYVEVNDLLQHLPDEPYKGAIRRVLLQAPAADVAPVVHGRWVCIDTDTEQFFVCRKCGNKEYWESDYCPNCGSRMDGKDGETDGKKC